MRKFFSMAIILFASIQIQAQQPFYTGLSRLIFNHWKHTSTSPWGGCSVRYATTFNDAVDAGDNLGSTATLGLVRNGARLLTERRAGTNPDTLYLFHNTGSAMWGTFRISFAMGSGSLFVPGSTVVLHDLYTSQQVDISQGLFNTNGTFNSPVYYDYTATQSIPESYGNRFMIVIQGPQ